MKTKEEILYDLGLGLDPASDELILGAMEEYALQFLNQKTKNQKKTKLKKR